MKKFKSPYLLFTWTILSISTIGVCSPSYAARYALLVGVGDYPMAELEGPINDVNAIQEVLHEKWQFKGTNIRTLVNQEGTKKNILAEMQRLLQHSKKGDEIFLYFSGHGTSAKDRALHFPLPTTSGAFIPYDVRDARTVKQILNILVVGKTDLRPLLTEMDNGGRHVFVVIDACYSGNAVRGKMKDKAARLPSRYLDLETLLPGRVFGDDLINTGDEVWQSKTTNPNDVYPYENIYFLSASGEHEQAKDIPSRLLTRIPTIDGKAHGAFTDTLLRILNNPGSADLNNDGELSYAEATKTVRRLMRRRGFDHTPNGLPSIAQDRSGLATRGLFRNTILKSSNRTENKVKTNITDSSLATTDGNTKTKTNEQNSQATDYLPLKVSLGGGLEELRLPLSQLSNVKIVKSHADVKVNRIGDEIVLTSAAGDVITRAQKPDSKTVVKLVKYQVSIHDLVNQPLRQDFNVYLEIYGEGKGSTAVKGENVGFAITSEMDAYLLLIDIDSRGKINVIYPYFDNELQLIRAQVPFIRKDIAVVGPPYGRDYVQVYAFKKLVPELKQLVGLSFSKESPQRVIFDRLITNNSLSMARASLELISTERR